MHKKNKKGFTLIELVAVIAIIGILAGLTIEKIGTQVADARDVRRKSDLRKLENALAAYYMRNGSFPLSSGCPGACNWYSSEGDFGGNNNGNWIPGLTPTYVSKLPTDPRGGSSTNAAASCSGKKRSFIYLSNGTGSVYKLVAFCSAEGPMLATDAFYDPARTTFGWMVCSGEPACTSW